MKKVRRKNPTDQKILYVCHGSVHSNVSEYTLDIDPNVLPSIETDISSDEAAIKLQKYRSYFDKAVLEKCPFFVFAYPMQYAEISMIPNTNLPGTFYPIGLVGNKKIPLIFIANPVTFINLYFILKPDGLVEISNWGLLESYAQMSLQGLKMAPIPADDIAKYFIRSIRKYFKIREIIGTSSPHVSISEFGNIRGMSRRSLVLQKV